MNFAFLNPFFLIGLAAVALPVIAHLISKKSGIRKSFSSIQFLVISQGQAARTSKIKDLILLLIRSLILVLIVLVFSKPAVFSFSNVDVQDAKSVAIVIDNSFSMGYRDNFETAKSKAEKLIEALPDGGFGFVVPLVQTGNDTKPEVTQDKNKISEDLRNIRLSYSFTDNEARLEEILGFLKKAPNEKKEVILFTDLQKNGWKREPIQREWLIPVDVTEGEEMKNYAVSDVEYEDREDSSEVSVKVSNNSKVPMKNLLSTVSLGNKEINGFFDIQEKSEETKKFVFSENPPPESEIKGKVEIPHDNLEVDDARYFVFSKSEEPRILIVDGDPREDARLSETYYVARVVETISEIAPLNILVKDNDAFLSEGLEKYDLILLSNVGDLTPQKAVEVEQFVERGGAIVIFPGDRVRGSVYNTLFQNILPAELGTVEEGNYSLSATRFAEKISEKLKEVKIEKLFSLRPTENSNTLLAGLNFPFLVQRQLEKGSVFLFASAADTYWSNFPITPVFLPIMKEIFDLSVYTHSQRRNFLVGESVEIGFPEEANEVTVENPSGEEAKVYTENPKFDNTLVPGIYGVRDGETALYSFSVNIDPRESNLEKISIKSESPRSGTKSGLVKVFEEIWSYFLWGAIALFVSESVLRVLYTK